jgi:hypothetical protein
MRNLTVVAKAVLLIALVAIVLTLSAIGWMISNFPIPPEATLRVPYLVPYVSFMQVIVVGVVVTLVSVVVPLMLPEARDRFEQYKESRQAYSRAKTAVIYLPDRVVANVDREKAFVLVEEAHREIHLAETFEEVIIAKGYLKWFANPGLWILYNYWQIVAVAEVLRHSDWSAVEDREMLRERLRHTLAVVHRRFGKRGEHCAGETWDLKGGRFQEEKALEQSIATSLKSRSGSA